MYYLAIHASHHGSLTIFNQKQILVHTQLERFNRFKGYAIIEKKLIDKLKQLTNKIKFEKVYVSGLHDNCVELWKHCLIRNGIIDVDNFYTDVLLDHHKYHAHCSALINPIDNCVVADGRGALRNNDHEYFSIYKNLNNIITFTDFHKYSLGGLYECMRREFGWWFGQEGNLMALSTYGKFNKEIEKELWDGERFNNKLQIVDDLKNKLEYNYSVENKDVAKTFQEVCEKAFLNIIKKFDIEKELTLTGGFAQNIINNTKLLKLYNVHVDPFNNDQGISLGMANWLMHNKLKKLDTVYLGFKPEYNYNFSNNFELKDIDIKEVAKLLVEEPIALFQDRSEQGQRGLGNRSLLINPFAKNCLEKINKIKKREWFRPFAATVTKQKLNNYFFEHQGDGRYMLFTYDVREQYKEKFKNILSNEDNCRLQVLDRGQNVNYYNLIKELSYHTNFEIVLNTSLNLPGEPLVEDLNDLEEMMVNSNLKYAYLPEINKLVIKHEKL